VVYLAIFVLLRVIVKQAAGSLNLADLLLIVLIADAAQNAMAGGYDTFAEGAVLVCTIVGWNWLLDVLAWRFAWVRRFATPSRLTLVRAGVMQLRNMRREYITREELEEKLREQGIAKLVDVEVAYLEGDGQISVIKRETSGSQAGPRKSAAAGGR
jgi:uncharacterized membrane protein YcaP (DUF421 family)